MIDLVKSDVVFNEEDHTYFLGAKGIVRNNRYDWPAIVPRKI